jgi:RecJ-like exonuclease
MSNEIQYPDIKTLDFPDDLLEKLNTASNLIMSTGSPIKVISHYDADGLCAGAILCAILSRLSKRFHLSLHHGLEPGSEVFTELKNSEFEVKIFLDMGSGQLEMIEKLNGWNIILDHHKLIQNTNAKNIVHINAHLFGFNGAVDVCGSSMAFILGLHISPRNWDLIYLALAGAIGDKQNKHGFQNINQKLLITAIEHGLITEELKFKPRGDTVLEAITNSTDPYFVNLSNNENAVKKLLESLDIKPTDNTDALNQEKLQRLSSYLTLKLLDQGITPEDAEGVITTKFFSPLANVELEELSHQINACGRMGQMGIGVAAGLGDKWAVNHAKQLRAEYKQKIRAGLERLENQGLTEMENIQYFFEEIPEFAGTFAGIGMMYFFNQSKPVLALTRTEKSIKVSGRGTPLLISAGVDLANGLSEVASELGGTGGGHDIAAGATIPLENEKEFLDRMDKLVGKQLMKND